MDGPPPHARRHRPRGPALAGTVLLLTARSAWAQAAPSTSAVPVVDSAQAVAVACAVVQGLRRAAERYRCRVERYAETSGEYVIRVREDAATGSAPLDLSHSEVRLSKTTPSVTVSRVPGL
jgi:hypothetical protein